ncbi:hypothetical protein E4T52_09067 [Aureobasidium sp. EXF-3400]|nr:hypothetical protein E4T51_10032 [Aureobasidium sp. EXF-12344]KAI4775985.1 hypothetical protein E4T52_09067 [Aureobasidium sp. EXF-3400]
MPFTDWSRIKSARPQMYDSIWKSKTPPSRSFNISESTERDSSRQPESAATIHVESVTANQFGPPHDYTPAVTETQESNKTQRHPVQDQDGETYIDWIDPKTNHKHRINARTGIVMPDESHRPRSDNTSKGRATAAANARLSSFGNPLVLERRKDNAPSTHDAASSAASASPWLQGFLKTWKNPIFKTQSEDTIQVAGLSGLLPGTIESLVFACWDD